MKAKIVKSFSRSKYQELAGCKKLGTNCPLQKNEGRASSNKISPSVRFERNVSKYPYYTYTYAQKDQKVA